FFFFQAEYFIRDRNVTGFETCAHPILAAPIQQRSKIDITITRGQQSCAFGSAQLDLRMVLGLHTTPTAYDHETVALLSDFLEVRSEERRVGKECRCRWRRWA